MQSHGDSPILLLQEMIAGAPFVAAPEKQADLEQFARAANLQIDFRDDRREICVVPTTGEITLGIAALEHLWASAYLYYVLYDEYAQAQRRLETRFDSKGHPRTSVGIDLLNWALNKWNCRARGPWPPAYPRPERDPTPSSDGHIANELFRYAIAWTLHHEIAHVRLQHPAILDWISMPQEREADLAATDWVLGDCVDPRHLRMRTLGVVVAILALDSLEFVGGDTPIDSHPKAYERLAYCLNQYAAPEEDEAFAFALCGMQFNCTQPWRNGAAGWEFIQKHFGRAFLCAASAALRYPGALREKVETGMHRDSRCIDHETVRRIRLAALPDMGPSNLVRERHVAAGFNAMID